MVNVVYRTGAVLNTNKHLKHIDDVFLRQGSCAGYLIAPHPPVKLHSPYGGEIVALRTREEIVEQRLRCLLGRRFTRTHHAVDLDLRLHLTGRRVQTQGLGYEGTLVDVVSVNGFERLDRSLAKLANPFSGYFLVHLPEKLTRLRIDNVMSKHPPSSMFLRNLQADDTGLANEIDVARGNPATLFDDKLPFLVFDIETGQFSTQLLRLKVESNGVWSKFEQVGLKKRTYYILGRVTKGPQQYRGRQFSTTVNAYIHQILRIKLKIQPRAPVRNDARGKEQFPRGMGFALVVLKENPWGAVKLGDDDPLRSVNDECTGIRHDRYFSHVDFLLFDVFDRF